MMASRRRFNSNSGGGFGALFGLLLVIAIIIKFIWWILGAAALVGLFFLVRAIVRESHKRADAYARHCAAIAARADQQHNWVLQGDDRLLHGPPGAELMHYVYPATKRNSGGLTAGESWAVAIPVASSPTFSTKPASVPAQLGRCGSYVTGGAVGDEPELGQHELPYRAVGTAAASDIVRRHRAHGGTEIVCISRQIR